VNYLKKKRGFKKQVAPERFPFVDIYWDSVNNQPRVFAERPLNKIKSPDGLLSKCFSPDGLFAGKELSDLLPLLNRLNGNKRIRVQETLLDRLDGFLQEKQMDELAHRVNPPAIKLKTRLYPYQESGIEFGLFKKAAHIGDEMGLGKTLQAAGILRQIYSIRKYRNVLIDDGLTP
jgi:SNF2 family DNA or RNA helicase